MSVAIDELPDDVALLKQAIIERDQLLAQVREEAARQRERIREEAAGEIMGQNYLKIVLTHYHLSGMEIHEVKPIKFGGSPTDPANKTLIDSDLHRRTVTPWWQQLQRDIERRP